MTRPWKASWGWPLFLGNSRRNDERPSFWRNTTATTLLPGSWPRTVIWVTVALYVLNQKHLLPKPLSRVVSKALFWPSMPITVGRRIGKWQTVVDQTVIMGGAPFGFCRMPEQLYEQYGVSEVCLKRVLHADGILI